jgi:hypothetical protein
VKIFTESNNGYCYCTSERSLTKNYTSLAWVRKGTSNVGMYLILLNKARWKGVVRYKEVRHNRCGVCGQETLRCKCRIVNWIYVTVEFVRNATEHNT